MDHLHQSSILAEEAIKEKSGSESITELSVKKNFLESFNFTVDTLMVDTGEDLINFGIPFIGSPSPDARYYFILNYKTLQLQKIDLGSLNLTDTFSFEKVGAIVQALQLHFSQYQ